MLPPGLGRRTKNTGRPEAAGPAPEPFDRHKQVGQGRDELGRPQAELLGGPSVGAGCLAEREHADRGRYALRSQGADAPESGQAA